ncbi:hypothetical protein CSHISOI_01939 [Colletotrichum shisoi]|uniref:Uncharacterized protein n=1 Tax=Colletotrichum shisoi TaxID=2078593 RepID=A0A5Q4C3V8_9PEZI|nr:hypothetical protein CSHISOI_01939 [Colletotrichum shisoi]
MSPAKHRHYSCLHAPGVATPSGLRSGFCLAHLSIPMIQKPVARRHKAVSHCIGKMRFLYYSWLPARHSMVLIKSGTGFLDGQTAKSRLSSHGFGEL